MIRRLFKFNFLFKRKIKITFFFHRKTENKLTVIYNKLFEINNQNKIKTSFSKKKLIKYLISNFIYYR